MHHVEGAVQVVDLVLEDVRQLPLRRLLVLRPAAVLPADADALYRKTSAVLDEEAGKAVAVER